MSAAQLSRMAFGFASSQIIHAAVRLGVPEALGERTRAVPELAEALGCDETGLARLLEALSVLGVVEGDRGGQPRFALTELGRPLCAGHPESIRSSVLLYGEPAVWSAWGALAEGVRTGTAAFENVHGRALFDYMAGLPGLSAVFNRAMLEGTKPIAAALPEAYDFSTAGTVLDVGGGSGTLLAGVLAATPKQVRGILFDSPDGAAGAEATFEEAGVSDRVAVAHGDFFQRLPAADVMLLKGILHDWTDEQCAALLRNCRTAIEPEGRLLILEPLLAAESAAPGSTAPDSAAAVFSDISMLVYTGGRERRAADYRALLRGAGFELIWVTPPLSGTAVRALIAQPR